MNELKTNNDFDYSSLDKRTAENLREKEYALVGIHARYSNEVGKVLYEAREDLAKYYKGTFEKWYTGLGFKTTNVYSYINAYKYTLELEGSSKFEELEIFKRQPKSLQNEMSKPSAIPEVNQKVFEGDITAHKDYKEIEMHYQQQLKQKDELIGNMADSMHDFELQNRELEGKVQRLKNKPAEVVEKPVVPDDYEQVKESNDKLATELDKVKYEASTLRQAYETLRSKQQEEEEGSKKYRELTEAIKEMEGKMTRGQKRIQAQKQVYELVDLSKELLMKITPIPHLVDSDYVRENPIAKRELENIANQTRKFLTYLEEVLKEPNIIEGEFTNE